ncbi:MAG: transcription termination/antitermination protein NusG [Candidatus Rokuibacteriota bacterium]
MMAGGNGRNEPADRQTDVAQDAALEPRWYAVRTRSRHEKRVRAQLADRPGIDVFLPLLERRSRWKDRIQRVQEPLFPGYCFARFRRPDRLRVLKAAGVVGLVGPSGEPEPIPDSEIEAIRTLAGSRLSYEPFPFLAEGMAVEVIRGPLMGVRGRLLRKDRDLRVVLSVTLIRQSVSVEIDTAEVTPI